MGKTVTGVLVFLGAVMGLAACAGDDGTTGVMVETREMRFTPSAISVVPGQHVITVHNAGELRHTFSINSLGQEVTINPGQTKTLTVDVEPGTYRYVCRVLDHEGLGMHGVLRVKQRT